MTKEEDEYIEALRLFKKNQEITIKSQEEFNAEIIRTRLTQYEVEHFPELENKEKAKIKKLYIDGNNRDIISKSIHIGKDKIQPYFAYLGSTDLQRIHEEHKRVPIRNAVLDEKALKKDFEKGLSHTELRYKYHLRDERLGDILSGYSNDTLLKHEKAVKEIRRKSHKIDRFFNRNVENYNYKIYVAIEFNGFQQITNYRNYDEPFDTNYITKGINGKGDMAQLLTLIDKKYDEIREITIKDYSKNQELTLEELKRSFGF